METRRLWQMWWSGVFAVGAVGHLIRLIAQATVVVGGVAIPLWVSAVVAAAAGTAAALLFSAARGRRSCDAARQSEPLDEGGDTVWFTREEVLVGPRLFCGPHAYYHYVGEDDEPET